MVATSLPDRMRGSLADEWRQARPAQRFACLVGGTLILVGLAHLAAWLVLGGAWQGPVSFRKPTTFGISFGLTTITLAWITGHLRISDRTAWLLLGPLAAADNPAVPAGARRPGGGAQRRLPGDRPTMGVLLTDGVGEIELASAFRPYTELSYLARPVTVTTHGGRSGPGVAKTLQYPTTNPRLAGPVWPWTLTLRPILLAAAAVAAVLGIRLRWRRRRSTRQHRPGSRPRRGACRGADPTERTMTTLATLRGPGAAPLRSPLSRDGRWPWSSA